MSYVITADEAERMRRALFAILRTIDEYNNGYCRVEYLVGFVEGAARSALRVEPSGEPV